MSGDDLDAAVRAGRRGQLVGGIFFLAVIVVGALVASGAFGGGGDPARDASYVDGVRGVRETTALLRGVEQDGIRLGRADAPATVVVFADLKCSACRRFALKEQGDVVRDLVRTGKANLELRLIGLKGFEPDNLTGRNAAYALAEQDRMWPLVELLYWNQGEERERWIDDTLLRKLAGPSPELRGTVPSTRETPGSRRLSAETDALRASLGVDRTPSFFVRARGADASAKASYAEVGRGGPLADQSDRIADAVADVPGR
ncbi:DsbA family protein [Patulibacter americanus]|uniref:DsbA family protein n=1 Tax=Patulibacter americanus TaxID=588672 RepID=UPI0003B69709|nr:thioredoxin domain-containing protein [Patulibacter americanus]